MKKLKKISILLLLLNIIVCFAPQKTTAQVGVSFQVFYDNLSPYGNWVAYSNYGYVWVPNVPRGFAPYGTNGYWVFTDVGWTWVSNYSWGWAPFHYGRWLYDPYYGWVWVPDTEWGPGWVTWRSCEGYYGWAPIGPGISIDIAYSSGYNVPHNQWIFVRDRDFGRTNINNYYIRSSDKARIIGKSKVINNIQRNNSSHVRYNAGPDRADVQKRTGAVIPRSSLKEINKPGQRVSKGEVQLYKPRVEKNVLKEGRKPAPSRVMDQKDIKSMTQRNTEAQTKREAKNVTKQRNELQINQQKAQQQQREQQKMNQQRAQQQQVEQQKVNQQRAQQQRNEQQRVQQLRNEQQKNNQQKEQLRNEMQVLPQADNHVKQETERLNVLKQNHGQHK